MMLFPPYQGRHYAQAGELNGIIVPENRFEQEELAWLQQGRANWLRHGD
jgi:hypothetical protein